MKIKFYFSSLFSYINQLLYEIKLIPHRNNIINKNNY